MEREAPFNPSSKICLKPLVLASAVLRLPPFGILVGSRTLASSDFRLSVR